MSPRARRERVPRPPPVATKPLPPLVDDQISHAWRLHWEDHPRDPPHHATGRFRFDAPKGEYQVTYVNPDRYAPFGEVYGDERSIATNQADRWYSHARSTRPLRVVDLDNSQTLAAHNLDLRISSSVDYERTMRWGYAFHEWYPGADGIRYLGRHAAMHLNYCLFLDRCADDLEFEPEGRLRDLRSLVLRAADAYNLAPRLFEPRDPASTI